MEHFPINVPPQQLLPLIIFLILPVFVTNQPSIFLQQNSPPQFPNGPFYASPKMPSAYFAPNRLAHGCKHFCSISEKGAMPCWNDTRHYYEQMLVGLMRRTVAAQSNRVMWMMATNQQQHPAWDQIDFSLLANEFYHRLRSMQMKQRIEDANNWEQADFVYARLSRALLQNVEEEVNRMLRNQYGHELPQLDVECPHGCERSWDTWKWLFMCSLLVTFLLLAILAFSVFRLDQREQNDWKVEAVEVFSASAKLAPRQQNQLRTLIRVV